MWWKERKINEINRREQRYEKAGLGEEKKHIRGEKRKRVSQIDRPTLLKSPIKIRGYIYYGELAIVENVVQLQKGILLSMASNICCLRTGFEQWCTHA